ncbi:MAG TPA: hypothetical protein VMU63_11270 [Acidimicrobiales bacterium]|nr:hypothetical protein [Acidimicrobiales bacterium]
MPFNRSHPAGAAPFRRRPAGLYALAPDFGRQGGRALVATLAGAIVVLGSAAGSTAFVMQSMKSAPNMSVSVAPVITLRPAAPRAASTRPPLSVRTGSPASRPTPAPGAASIVSAPAPGSPPPAGRLLAAVPVPAEVHQALSALVGASPAAAKAAAAAAKAAAAAAAGPVTVVTQVSPVTAGILAQPLVTATRALPSTTPVVAGPRVAKVHTVRSLDFVTPPPLMAPRAVAVAQARVHLAAAARARAVHTVNPSAGATVALRQVSSARKIQGGDHHLWAETDGLNGPSTHHRRSLVGPGGR